MNKVSPKKIDELEEQLIIFWEKYMDVLDTLRDDAYVGVRTEMFNSEMASKMHDIQGRLSILKTYLKVQESEK